ncbi:putative transferase [Helianthus anomalus]
MSSCNIRFTMERHSIPTLVFQMLIILACFAISNAVQSDIDCLRSIKEILEDPENLLSSWDFNSNTEGFVCRFTGIECWHPDESKVLNIRLSDMGLRGPFPVGLKNCTSLTTLDLSSNHLTGQLPSNVSDFMRFLTTLDLSSNNLSGPIPSSFADLSFINVLRLDNNQLTGEIPWELAGLDRIKEFDVANNRLSGQVPIFRNVAISADSYEGNLGLCGGPLLPRCVKRAEKDLFLAGFAVGFPFFLLWLRCL